MLVDVVAELGGDHHVVTPFPERVAEDPLAVPGAVVRGGVEEVHAELERAAERTHGLGVVDRAPSGGRAIERPRAADRPAAHPEGADLDLGAAEPAGE